MTPAEADAVMYPKRISIITDVPEELGNVRIFENGFERLPFSGG
jgi:hypothetical protein